MILQRLSDFYDRISVDPATSKALPRSGFSLQKVSFCIVLGADGSFQSLESLTDEGNKKPVPQQMLVPGQSKPTGAGINPCFLWDNAAYMLGFKPEDPKPERTRDSFEAFRSRHVEVEQIIASPAFTAVCKFLKCWSPADLAATSDQLGKFATHFGVFKMAGVLGYVHDDPKVMTYWAGQAAADDADVLPGNRMCLVTGSVGPAARLHKPSIKGVVGSQSSGAMIVSFNDTAYESFGKGSADNAPVSVGAAFKYTNALNFLLNQRRRRIQLGDATVIFWADRPTPLEEYADTAFGDFAPPKPDAPPEDIARAEQARNFLTQLRDGHAAGTAIHPDSSVGFYILGLSPNASRLSVRLWVQSTVGEMEARLRQHLQDMNLIGARPDDPPVVIRRIVEATGRAKMSAGKFQGYDADVVPPLLSGAIARAVFQGTPYPAMLLGQMLNRIRADGYVSHVRVATIKAYLVRNSRLDPQPTEVDVSLNPTRADPAYVTGRVFALLEKIQSDSLGGDINATIKDRYFSSASATPGIVFPRLIRLSQHHLAKMEPGQKVYYERLLGEAIGKLDGFANRLALEDQGLFAVGYFHQRQDLFTSKKTIKEGDSQ